MLLTTELIEQSLVINGAVAKTFVFDLDGTLIYNGKPLSLEFENLLLKIKAAGHEVIFATGRSLRDFVPIVPKWCTDQPSVLYGGGLVVANKEIKAQNFLDANYLNEIIKFLEDNHAHYLIDGIANYYHPAKEHWLYSEIIELTGQHKAHSLDAIFSEDTYKILVLDDLWLAHFRQFSIGKDLLIKFHSYDKCFDIMPAQVNKYNGLINLTLPQSEDVFIFGNDHNDLELMQNFPNSILFGNNKELLEYAKLQIEYDGDLVANLTTVINTVLKKG